MLEISKTVFFQKNADAKWIEIPEIEFRTILGIKDKFYFDKWERKVDDTYECKLEMLKFNNLARMQILKIINKHKKELHSCMTKVKVTWSHLNRDRTIDLTNLITFIPQNSELVEVCEKGEEEIIGF